MAAFTAWIGWKSLPGLLQLGSHGSLGGGKCLFGGAFLGANGGQQRRWPLEEVVRLAVSAVPGMIGIDVAVRARLAARRSGVSCIFVNA